MQTIFTISNIINYLLNIVESQISIRQLLKLAPTTTANQTNNAIKTMVYISFAQKYSNTNKIKQQKDPQPANIDTFGTAKISKQQNKQIPNKDNKNNQVDDKSNFLATEKSKYSYRSNRFALDTSIKDADATVKSKTSNKQSFFISLIAQSEVDGIQEKMRQAQNDRVNTQNQILRERETQMKERQKNKQESQRLLRDKKSFTYDYEGSSQAINPSKLPGETLRKMKQFLKQQGQIIKKQRNTQVSEIPNTRIKGDLIKSIRGQIPIFSQKGFSVIEALGDTSNISEGIKIIEMRGGSNNATLERKAKKLDGSRMYRLNDYKNLSKDKSFRQFPKNTSRKNSQIQLSSRHQITGSNEDQKLKTIRKQRSIIQSSGKSQQALKSQKKHSLNQALGRGLPFIRTKGLKFYDIGSTNSFKTVDFNLSFTDKKSNWKNKIKISDNELYDDILS